MSQQLSYGHYVELLPINNLTEINYYIMISEQYNLSIRKLRQRIKSNEYEKFPEDFYFQLTKDEFSNLKSQIVTSNFNEDLAYSKFQNETSSSKHGGIRKLPYVFTEQGVAMLATVLKR